MNGRTQGRTGNRHPFAAPHGVYRCRGDDRWCAIAVFDDRQWDSFCQVIGNPDWTREERFATFLARKQNEAEMDRLVEEWTATRTAEEVMERLQSAGVEAGVVQNGRDLIENDSQLRHRGHFHTFDHPETGRHVVEAAPYRLSRTSGEPRWVTPCLGEHNNFICTQILGMSDEEFVALMAEGVFD